MGFDFRLLQPPCNVAFLSVVNGPILYNADDTANGTVKEATIRQIGWHDLDLPPEWFFSDKARELMKQVCRTMQCTIQYLAYQQKELNDVIAKTRNKLDEVRAERDASFEELIELRETVALMKLRYGDTHSGGRRRAVASAAANESPRRPRSSAFVCSLCGNVYPSASSLESHTVKRHRRTQRYAAMAAASAAVAHNAAQTHQPQQSHQSYQLNQLNQLQQSAGVGAIAEEIASLRGDVIALRRTIGDREQKQQKQQQQQPSWVEGGGEAMSSPFLSPLSVIALPAQQLFSSRAGFTQEPMETMQWALRDTRARLAQMEDAVRHQNSFGSAPAPPQRSLAVQAPGAMAAGPLEPPLHVRGTLPVAAHHAVGGEYSHGAERERSVPTHTAPLCVNPNPGLSESPAIVRGENTGIGTNQLAGLSGPHAEGTAHEEKAGGATVSPTPHARFEGQSISNTNDNTEVFERHLQHGIATLSFPSEAVADGALIKTLGQPPAIAPYISPIPLSQTPGPNRAPASDSSLSRSSSLSKEEGESKMSNSIVSHIEVKDVPRREAQQERRAEQCDTQGTPHSRNVLISPQERDAERTIEDVDPYDKDNHGKPELKDGDAKKKRSFFSRFFKRRKNV